MLMVMRFEIGDLASQGLIFWLSLQIMAGSLKCEHERKWQP